MCTRPRQELGNCCGSSAVEVCWGDDGLGEGLASACSEVPSAVLPSVCLLSTATSEGLLEALASLHPVAHLHD